MFKEEQMFVLKPEEDIQMNLEWNKMFWNLYANLWNRFKCRQ